MVKSVDLPLIKLKFKEEFTMQKTKSILKALICGFTAAVMAVTAAGCAGSSDNGSEKTELKVDSGLRGTKVKVLTWYEVDERESSVSDAFSEKTGIDVKYIVSSTSNYQTKLASLVASGASPDLACILSTSYPSMLIRGLMSELDEQYFDLSDSVYDIDLMNKYKWNDKYYGVAVKGSMMGNMYCVYYNKTMFDERGQQTPYEIWKNNPDDWTWDKLAELAKNMTYTNSAGTVYGLSISYPYAFMLSSGEDFVKIEGSSITNNMSSNTIKNAWKFENRIKETDKSLMPGNAHYVDLIQGKTAMHINGQWFMQKGNSYDKEMTDEWGVAPFPKQNDGEYYVPFAGNMWGTPKNAENVAGAAAFIRYWLDPANEEAAVYASDECREVHEWLWKQQKSILFSEGIINFKSSGVFNQLCGSLMSGSNGVDTVLASQSPTIDSNIKLVLDEMN